MTLTSLHAEARQLTLGTMTVPGTTADIVTKRFAEKANEALKTEGVTIVVKPTRCSKVRNYRRRFERGESI